MYRLLPDIYQKDVFSIDYVALKDAGIKVILFDLDNTLAGCKEKTPNAQLKTLFDHIKGLNLIPLIISNQTKKKIAPYKDGLLVSSAYLSFKPLKYKYKKIMKQYKVKASQVAAVGDSLVSDVFGANRLGITSILVDSVGKELFFKKFVRFFENRIIGHYRKRGIFEKGVYYE